MGTTTPATPKPVDHDRCRRCIKALLAIIEGGSVDGVWRADVLAGARELLAELNAE
jgi:hypothetical protein